MSRTFRDINFQLRPGKNVLRKLMADMFLRLPNIHPIQDYQYIGFGSIYYSDHKLFHKRLGIDDMISIEEEEDYEERFEYNKPFECIALRMGPSGEELPRLKWEHPVILWLDYDKKLNSSMFSDMREFFTSAPTNSLIFVTFNSTPFEKARENGPSRSRLEQLEKSVGEDAVPNDINNSDLAGWDFSDACHDIVMRKINEEFLPKRGAAGEAKAEDEFHHLVNIEYQDNAKMTTVGGIIIHPDKEGDFRDTDLYDLQFTSREDEDPYRIHVPRLTVTEKRGLDSSLPGNPVENEVPVVDDLKRQYEEIYRQLPKFVESEL